MMTKREIREWVWTLLKKRGVELFPGAWGRIPNFVGAKEAAKRGTLLKVFRDAKFIKANPDSPQRPLRETALIMGKTIFMAVPRLRSLKCFIRLDPKKISSPSFASTIKGALREGELVHPGELPKIDLIIAGSVAVNRRGQRIGKGGGFSDLEYAIGRTFGFITGETPILTTVHPLQILEKEFPWKPHDIPVDFIVTPEEIIETNTKIKRPSGILPEFLTDEKIGKIPILRELLKG